MLYNYLPFAFAAIGITLLYHPAISEFVSVKKKNQHVPAPEISYADIWAKQIGEVSPSNTKDLSHARKEIPDPYDYLDVSETGKGYLLYSYNRKGMHSILGKSD